MRRGGSAGLCWSGSSRRRFSLRRVRVAWTVEVLPWKSDTDVSHDLRSSCFREREGRGGKQEAARGRVQGGGRAGTLKGKRRVAKLAARSGASDADPPLEARPAGRWSCAFGKGGAGNAAEVDAERARSFASGSGNLRWPAIFRRESSSHGSGRETRHGRERSSATVYRHAIPAAVDPAAYVSHTGWQARAPRTSR